MILPPEALPLLEALAPAFTRPTPRRLVILPAASILAQGRHTVANPLRTPGGIATGHRTDYRRALSRAPGSGPELGCALARLIVGRPCPAGPILLVGDDTGDGHPGRHVYGAARHRDPVRSSRSYTARKYGHRRVVLAVLVRSPWATRPRAPPVPVDPHRSAEDNRRRGRPHRTPAQRMCRLLRAPMIRFPGRPLTFVGDSGYGAHEVARSSCRHRAGPTPVSELHPEADLFDPPPPYRGIGRPRVKGGRRPEPREAVAAAPRRRHLTVGRYGGGTRRVSVVAGAGHRYRAGAGSVPIRWVHVRDPEGTHRDEDFYATDPGLEPGEIVTRYAGRWGIECTSQGCRTHLRSETTRGRCRRTVSRATRCLFGLYSVVALLDHALPAAKRSGGVRRPGKAGVTYSDAPASVRPWIWAEGVFPQDGSRFGLEKLPDPSREVLRAALAPAA